MYKIVNKIPKMSKMTPNDLKWPKIFYNGIKWYQIVQNVLKWSIMIKCPTGSKIVQKGQQWYIRV